MTYLKILMYARAGIQAKIDEYRGMREKALEGAGAHAVAKTLARKCQEMIDGLEVDMAKYHCPAGQGAGVLVFDAQNGQDEAPGQAQKQQKHQEDAQAVRIAQELQKGQDPALFSGQALPAAHTMPWSRAKR